MNRPNEVTIGPRFVLRELVKAEAALVAAQKATDDKLVADECAKARRTVSSARARAQSVLKHADLTTAPQGALFDPTQEEA